MPTSHQELTPNAESFGFLRRFLSLFREIRQHPCDVRLSERAISGRKVNGSAKAPKAAKAKEAKPKKLSAIDAAAKVLGETSEAMNCQEMIKAMAEKGYWTSPGGKTPAATLYSSILRELQTKGKDSRFKKTDRGKFTVAG